MQSLYGKSRLEYKHTHDKNNISQYRRLCSIRPTWFQCQNFTGFRFLFSQRHYAGVSSLSSLSSFPNSQTDNPSFTY